MPYFFLEDLPENIQQILPKQAQELYRRVFNKIWDYLQIPERVPQDHTRVELAARIAWAIIKKFYVKGKRKWHKRPPVTPSKDDILMIAKKKNMLELERKDREKLLAWIDDLLSGKIPLKPKQLPKTKEKSDNRKVS